MPLRWLYGLMQGLLYPVMYYLIRYRRKTVRRNLELAFSEMSDKERQSIEKGFYHWFCDLIAEIIYGYRISDEELRERVVFHNLDALEPLTLEKGGAMFMLAHIGCWEWIADVAKRFSSPDIHEHEVYRRLKNRSADRMMLTLRAKRGGDCIEKNSLIRRMISLRHEPGAQTYGMLSDQKPSQRDLNCWVPFFGMDIPFITGSETLGAKFGYPVWYVDISMPKRGYYEVTVHLLSADPSAEKKGAITAAYARMLEDNIRRQPEIWLWSHNRFKWNRHHTGDINHSKV